MPVTVDQESDRIDKGLATRGGEALDRSSQIPSEYGFLGWKIKSKMLVMLVSGWRLQW